MQSYLKQTFATAPFLFLPFICNIHTCWRAGAHGPGRHNLTPPFGTHGAGGHAALRTDCIRSHWTDSLQRPAFPPHLWSPGSLRRSCFIIQKPDTRRKREGGKRGVGGGRGALALFIKHRISGSQTQATHTVEDVGTGAGWERRHTVNEIPHFFFQDEHRNS